MNPPHRVTAPPGLRPWLWFNVTASAAGWLLSPLGFLKLPALIGLGLVVTLVAWFTRPQTQPPPGYSAFPRFLRRFRQPLPLAFAVLALLAFAGGVLHPPSNYDGLSYRTPRVLIWLAEGRWHWVESAYQRLNVRTAGFEWATLPILALFKTDRFLFLLNSVSFLIFPGLIFSVWRQLGVPGRVARAWMWLLPTGGCFALQAGSIGNDLFGALWPLAAMHYALRARHTRSATDAAAALLAAGLMTAAKVSNLPLLLPIALALLPSALGLLRKPLLLGATAVLGVTVSFLPTAVLNVKFCGDWTGLVMERAMLGHGSPGLYFTHSTALLTLQSAAPPIFPAASAWNRWIGSHLPPSWKERIDHRVELGAASYELRELNNEENAGLGTGPTLLLVLLAYASWRGPKKRHTNSATPFSVRLVRGSPWVSILVFLAGTGMVACGRVAAPYYAMLIPALVAGPGAAAATRRRPFQCLAGLSFALAFAIVIFSPARPLWPAGAVLEALRARHDSPMLTKAALTFEVYARRWDHLAPLREAIPAEEKLVGYTGWDESETSLWRPFDRRRVLHVTAADTADRLRARGLRYLTLSTETAPWILKSSLEDWVKQVRGTVVLKKKLRLRISGEPVEWWVVRLD